MKQFPAPEEFLLKWRGDRLDVSLVLPSARRGRAVLRTNIGHAGVKRAEIIDETEKGRAPLAKAWNDIPLEEVFPGVFSVSVSLDEVGVFAGKTCFFPEGSDVPEWPEGRDFRVKVGSAETRSRNSIYTLFPRQFGSFREVIRRIGHIMDDMGFRIIQTLPPFPVPVTYAVMGEYGCPFAATDFHSVDPAMAEFDGRTTPLDQFRELISAVHSRGGLLFIDLPANHTGWGSTLQLHHPEWFKRGADGKFVSPGAWGVVWEDLVELDYSRPELKSYMADVFLHWCRAGVDGFRCDAGYMIPSDVWMYIVSRVRDEYPDTVFMLEGLGGDIAVTDDLLSRAGLDWAYSELFQTYDRGAFEWYLPMAAERAGKFGALVHFAETHDNDRLAAKGETWARLRVQLAALLSWQGAWGITNGVEWFATEKIDVHGKNDLNWGSASNMIPLISRLNSILSREEVFSGASSLVPVTRGEGNTLAVLRAKKEVDRAKLLVLANLDCAAPGEIDFDRAAFPFSEAFDLLSERKISLAGKVPLSPGQVMCLSPFPSPSRNAAPAAPAEAGTLFHIDLESDMTRDVVVPAGEKVEVSAHSPFRMRVVDPVTSRALFVARSYGSLVSFTVPPYEGDGSRCRLLKVDTERYRDGKTLSASFNLAVPPPWEKAVMRLSLDGDEVRAFPLRRTALSNGSGAAALLRLGWGTVASQYDAFLAANPDASVPSDRLNLWTRTRCWLQCEGYVREIDSKCLDSFTASPAGIFAVWRFTVPCGMGREASFVFTHSLVEGENAASLRVVRVKGGESDFPSAVRLVFRPDIEWRSFHETTKAYLGAEGKFVSSARPVEDRFGSGFDFSPSKGVFSMRVTGGKYHHEPHWTYNVPHPEEAARAQAGEGDLFSPGWISSDLAADEKVVIAARYIREGERFTSLPEPSYAEEKRLSLPLADSLAEAMRLYIVKRDSLKTVIAGYPWFLDWGRDTFIFMRGMIASGMIDESVEILRAFAAFEERGTLPNIIYGNTAGNRDTADAQLWFIRCVQEVQERSPSLACLKELRKTCDSIVDNYIGGTSNSIAVDDESFLVWTPSHFTWMDTNYPACTPREGYPVEIQALWISALKYLGREKEAAKALSSLQRLFRTDAGYCDCLDAPRGGKASEAVKDTAVRPNQLFLLTLGVTDDVSVLRATEKLLIPGGMRSLSADHPLYRGKYEGDEDTSRKPAYHNGTAWMWPFPLYAEALFLTRSCPPKTALSLLASAVENLNEGCLCHLSEIADGDSPHIQKGCAAQAWSVSEVLRVFIRIKSSLVLLFCLLSAFITGASRAESVFSQDREVFVAAPNYDEAAVEKYSLEDPLVFSDGSRVKNLSDWARRRVTRGWFAVAVPNQTGGGGVPLAKRNYG